MRSYLLKADADRFDRWRAAAVAGGYPSLAAFLRRGADELVREGHSAMSNQEVASVLLSALEKRSRPPEEPSFRPDFGKRLKP